METLIHYFFHLAFPLFLSWIFFKKEWKKVYVILLSTMLVDIDHLFATPIFQANRCSIQFHPLHSYYAVVAYIILLFFKKPLNIIGFGLLLHIATDLLDCLLMYQVCNHCFSDAPAIGLIKWISQIFF